MRVEWPITLLSTVSAIASIQGPVLAIIPPESRFPPLQIAHAVGGVREYGVREYGSTGVRSNEKPLASGEVARYRAGEGELRYHRNAASTNPELIALTRA